MFSPKYYNRYLDDQFDRHYYGAKLKLKKFDTDEFQSLSYIYCSPHGDEAKIPTCVDVNSVSFHYNSFAPILNKISLQVPQGKIYALLGASGCGKTTLLRMILGRLKPLTGTIKVFGSEPGSATSNIPGCGVGYMPQELALFESLTINEVLHYYGRIYDLQADIIHQKVEKFIALLNLPSKHRKVSQLSGGQQRRVSLAVTLIHQPPLLILDEPTVGVDSMLRLRIWNYLEDLCRHEGTTVLITTHYTEEARNAFRVGFIDSGTLLGQDNPERLIYKYNCRSLEDVFLELCLQKTGPSIKNGGVIEEEEEEEEPEEEKSQENKFNEINNYSNNNNNNNCDDNKRPAKQQKQQSTAKLSKKNSKLVEKSKKSNLKQNNNNNNQSAILSVANLTLSNSTKGNQTKPFYQQGYRPRKDRSNKSNDAKPITAEKHSCDYIKGTRLGALLKKNYVLFKRNPVSIILLNVLPIIQIALYCISFDRNPKHIPIAVVNKDNRSTSLSNLFLSHLDDTVRVVPYDTLPEAIESIRKVHTWLAVTFPRNFSRNFRRRFTRPEKVTSRAVKGSKIALYPDNTHSVFALYTYRALIDAFEVFVKKVGGMLGFNPSFFGSPIQLMPPVYGTYTINYGEYLASGMIVSIVHGMSMLIGSFCIVRERNEGHLERGFVAGVKPVEVVLSHIIYLVLPVLSQVIFVIGLSFFYFQVRLEGSLVEVFVLSILSALQGLIFGVAISMVCPTEVASLVLVFAIEMPLIFTSGVLYPLESLNNTMQSVMMWNPLTLPINALRNIMLRGWTLANYNVFIGLVSSISYTTIVLMFSFTYFLIFNHY